MSHSENYARTSRKRNKEEEPQTNQELSFYQIRSHFDKKFAEVNEKFPTEVKHLPNKFEKTCQNGF